MVQLWGKINDEYEQKKLKTKKFLSLYSWQRTLSYIDRKGADGERAQARIYLGRAQKENGLYDDAFDSYNAALYLALKTNNYAMAGYACSYIADTYMDRDLIEDAIRQNRSRLRKILKTNDLTNLYKSIYEYIYRMIFCPKKSR